MSQSDLAIQRLEKLIKKGRAHLYKPIQIAEVLYHNRVVGDATLDELETYRRPSTRWRNEICQRLFGRPPVLNSRYEDQLFHDDVLPPELLVELGKKNPKGEIEALVYRSVRKRMDLLIELRDELARATPKTFKLADFLKHFERQELRRSVDKAYEVIVYALFDSLIRHLRATVTLSVEPVSIQILRDFQDFAKLVLGISAEQPQVTQPARLYRVGAANAADTGLDMWANFGPAVQVKHLTLDTDVADDIAENLAADQIVIVCRAAEASSIEAVMKQVGLGERIRGIVTENDLLGWYDRCLDATYAETLGRSLLEAFAKEFELEFPLSHVGDLDALRKERGYA